MPVSDQRALVMYTIYHRPTDWPGVQFIVRRAEITAGTVQHGAYMGTANTLDQARDLVPNANDLVCVPRRPDDDPVIVEVWL
ncbi:MAG: hypothetical protein ABWY93_18750 [Mycobacterium sp.]